MAGLAGVCCYYTLQVEPFLALQGIVYFLYWIGWRLTTSVLALLALANGIMLLIGWVTRFAGVLADVVCMWASFSWLPSPGLDLFATKATNVAMIAIVTAIICLGPGLFRGTLDDSDCEK